MVEQFEVIWSSQAELDLQNILSFWLEYNKSIIFPEKLYHEILDATENLVQNPYFGKNIQSEEYRRILVRYYLIIYRIEKYQIRILRIWDGRQKELNV
jgi:plasmid stabilization system protein ParE